MPRQTREKVQETREKVLLGALAVFSKKGFSRSTMDDIAKHIHMTRGAVYWHFKDKQDLMAELTHVMLRRETELVRQRVPVIACLDDITQNFLAQFDILDKSSKFRNFIKVIFMQVEWATEKKLACLKDKVPAKDIPFHRIHEALLEIQAKGEIRPGVDVEQLFDVIRALFTGLLKAHLAGINSAPARESLVMGLNAIFANARGQ